MNKSIEFLRVKFYAETDIEITTDKLSKYETWLESINSRQYIKKRKICQPVLTLGVIVVDISRY